MVKLLEKRTDWVIGECLTVRTQNYLEKSASVLDDVEIRSQLPSRESGQMIGRPNAMGEEITMKGRRSRSFFAKNEYMAWRY
jgi:hypothetical protein